MKTMYLVIGNTGNYDDYHEWNVGVFENEQIAGKYAQMCQSIGNELHKKVKEYRKRYKRDALAFYAEIEKLSHKLDPNFPLLNEYVGAYYDVTPVKVISETELND